MPKSKPVIDPIDASFDDLVGAVLGSKAPAKPPADQIDHGELIRSLTTPKGWGVSVDAISKQDQIRMDAEHYEPGIVANYAQLKSLGVALAPLSDFADVELPSMFSRIWAQDAQHGIPYLNATDLMSYITDLCAARRCRVVEDLGVDHLDPSVRERRKRARLSSKKFFSSVSTMI